MPQGSTAAPGFSDRRPEQTARMLRIRRFAVPRHMIERATERRLAGDWRGACAAANMDVAVDLPAIEDRYGADVAARVEDDLIHLVPDLVRWHAPRVGPTRTTLTPGQALVLNDYGLHGENAPRLHVTPHRWLFQGSQRMVLRFGPVFMRDPVHICTDHAHTGFWRGIVQSWAAARHLWDDRHTGELRERCGGDAERVPFLDPDGTPRAAGDLPGADPGPDDPAGHAEWVTMLHERGEVEAAFAAAGIELLPPGPGSEEYRKWYTVGPLDQLARMPLALTRLGPELRRLGGGRFQIPWTQHSAVLFDHDGGRRLRAAVVEFDGYDEEEREDQKELHQAEVLAEAVWRRLPDLGALREGRLPPEWLHPLVHDALFPGREARAGRDGLPCGPPEPQAPAPVRVRCRGEWHEVRFQDGVLAVPHSAQEQEREKALEALGGDVGGCFAVRKAWRTGKGRLPKVLREQRQELFDRAHHGDTQGVVRLLDLGVDPHVRDGYGRTLLHLLHLVDFEELLPRLLEAGLDLEAVEEGEQQEKRTALHRAVELDGSVELVRALLDAGARIDLLDEEETTILRLIYRAGRDDLKFLEERIEEEYPELMDY
ncbi:ankyrin repeat domain-containing protein [Spirillospora sp. CA-255316]